MALSSSLLSLTAAKPIPPPTCVPESANRRGGGALAER
jgi:hypothetical protein